MKKWTFIILSMIATSYLIVGCGGGDWKAPVDTMPELWQKEISTKEYNKNLIPVTNFCKNATEIVLNLNWLPSYYSLQDNNTTLKIDLRDVDVPDDNRERIIPVTCINWNNKVDWNITSKEIDIANDSPTIITNSNLPTNINVWEDYNASITAKDNDWWIESALYEIIDKDNNSIIEEWDMTCSDSNNTSTCNMSMSWLPEWNYTVNITVNGIIGGEHPQSEENVTKDFNVNSVNHIPNAKNDSATTQYNTPVIIDVLSNDSDQDDNKLTIKSVGNPSNGTAIIEKGKIKYTPNSWFSGNDSFTYTVSDGKGGKDTATVYVTILEKPNHAPSAQDKTLDAQWDDWVTYNMNNIIWDNETPKEDLEIIIVSWPNYGSLTWNWHTFTYEVTDGSWYAWDDEFTYKVKDSQWAESEIKTIKITNIADN